MFPLSLPQLARLVAATDVRESLPEIAVTGAVIDSRRVQPGDAFFALPGSCQHGVEFAAEAFAAGAVCVVTDQLPQSLTRSLLQRALLVTNAALALQHLASWNRSQSHASVIGITGSVGKTSTRQLIAAVLGTHVTGCQSPANYNNELGVPLTLLQLTDHHRFAAVEMGAGRPGDIHFLCELAKPTAAVVTRVAPCHLETFGTLEAIAGTKAELPRFLQPSDPAFLNADDPLVYAMRGQTKGRVVLYGEQASGISRLQNVRQADHRCCFECGSDCFSVEGPRQLVYGAAAAVAVGREWGMTAAAIQEGLERFQPGAGRGRVIDCGEWTVIDETYNSSPASLRACIETLSGWNRGRRILVAGEMLELGDEAEDLHRQAGADIAGSAVDVAVFTGRYSAAARAAAIAAGYPASQVKSIEKPELLLTELPRMLEPGDVVLIKASRALQFEGLVRVLEQQGRPQGWQQR